MFSAATKTGSQPAGAKNYIEDVFSTYLYTGTGTAQTITNNIDLATKGGLVWTKSRGTNNHWLYASALGTGGTGLISNDTAANTTYSDYNGLSSFNSNGFTIRTAPLGNQSNVSASPNVSWTFAKQPKFFDVVTYTGNGVTGRTISHALGATPAMMIVKCTSAATAWRVYHRSLPSAAWTLDLNNTSSQAFDTTIWNSTAPTSTVFTVGDDINANGRTYVIYLFAHDAGGFGTTGTDNVISCGSFTATSNSAIVNLGYEPQYILWKQSNASANWYIYDTMRGWSYSVTNGLYPNLSSAEVDDGGNATVYFVPTATGFQIKNFVTDGTYIYMAIRRPMKVPTDATTVFSPLARTGTNATATITGIGFAPDLVIGKVRDATYRPGFMDRLRGTGVALQSSVTSAEIGTTVAITAFGQNGVSVGADSDIAMINYLTKNYASWFLKRASGFFDEVCYTGNGVNGQAYTHNLGVTPEFMIFKRRNSTANWACYHKGVNGGTNPQDYTIYLNLTNGQLPGRWNSTAPTSSVFTVGNDDSVNLNTGTYVAYLFATCAGVSKVGSYTGNGTTQAIACGFTGGARFVLIKRTDDVGDWYVYDTARGMTLLTDPYLLLNSTAAESATLGSVTTTTGGFTVDASILAAINTNAASYIFLAIA